MQGLLERQSPLSPGLRNGNNNGNINKHTQILIIALCIVFSTYVALDLLPRLSPTTIGEMEQARTPSPPALQSSSFVSSRNGGARGHQKILFSTNAPAAQRHHPGDAEAHHHEGNANKEDSAPRRRSSVRMLQPWGYNTERNAQRWKVISRSIQQDRDVDDRSHGIDPSMRMTVVDYGADQGYFSTSTAFAFPDAFVIAVELGGKGGIIWRTIKPIDVLEVQMRNITELRLSNARICQTRVKIEHFNALAKRNLVHRYQYILSVFHWFPLPTRKDFEREIAQVFRNARTTFIELPTLGDHSKPIRNQVGYKNFKAWYDGRSDIGQVLSEAAASQNLNVRVTLLAKLPWLKWTRDIYRVDLVDVKEWSFDCGAHLEIYGCNMSLPKRFVDCENVH